MSGSELHVERLLGRRVRDDDGAVLGRIEELRADVIDGETVVTEIHLGPAALWERLGGYALQLPFFRLLPAAKRVSRVPWSKMDFSDPDDPRVVGSIDDDAQSAGTRGR
ncbi:MAG TPA: hypothetical protein VGQ44_15255 [Gemmatimonadaceae bacterium]|jgi:hypothetical protein|nr:hypothetical protein [Gemmatimonadaceae bacterium]